MKKHHLSLNFDQNDPLIWKRLVEVITSLEESLKITKKHDLLSDVAKRICNAVRSDEVFIAGQPLGGNVVITFEYDIFHNMYAWLRSSSAAAYLPKTFSFENKRLTVADFLEIAKLKLRDFEEDRSLAVA